MNANRNIALSCLLLLAAACSSESSQNPAGAEDGGAADAPTAGDPAPGADAAATDAAGDTTTRTTGWNAQVLASFDPASGQLPEGVTVKDGFAYAGFAPLGEIAKVDLRTGKFTSFAKIPKPVANKGFMTGLTFGPDGSLYAALVSFDPSVQPGIYRVPAAGGQGTLFAKDAKMVFPNGLAFDSAGALFVTDSAAGAIYEISTSGVVAPWATSDLLLGDQNGCGGSGNGFDIGANGLVLRNGVFYTTNTDKGSIVRFAVSAGGKAGPAEAVAGPDCAAFAGADGVTTDGDGNLIVAINRQNKIVRVSPSGAVDRVAGGDMVDFPASLEWNGSTLVTTNFALANASSGKAAHPGLLGITTR